MQTKIIGYVEDDEFIGNSICDMIRERGYIARWYKGFSEITGITDVDLWVFDNNTNERVKGIDMLAKYPTAILFSNDDEAIALANSRGRVCFEKNYHELLKYIAIYFNRC